MKANLEQSRHNNHKREQRLVLGENMIGKKKTAKQMEMVEIISMTHVSFFILKREADKS